MTACLAEDDLLELVEGRLRLGDAPQLEAHIADCAACSGLLSTLVAATPVERRDLVGTTLGPYRIDGVIGAGAMGEVYRAFDERLRREVAIKVLARQFADSPERVRRLESEARAAAAIAHPNVVTIYDTGSADGVPYIASELVRGETLRSVIDRGAIDRSTALDLLRQLVRGLAAAHEHGVVHRDLKPANLIVRDGTLKILDFGLAKVAVEHDVDATEPGTVLGTSGYLSPEQARGAPADARSDIFAVGAIGYELLSGTRAFDGATFAERLSAVLRDMPPALDDAAWPILERCLAKDPARRFQSATDLAWALDGPPPPRAPVRGRMVSRRAFLAGAAATGVAGAVLGRMFAPSSTLARSATYEQLTFRQGRVSRARFTPDGGSILYAAAWDGEPLAIHSMRLAGGGARTLALPSAQLLAVSSGGQLAISLDHHYLEGFHQQGQLALAPLEGGQPRALGVAAQDADFAPDDNALAVVRRVGSRFRLECPLDRVLLEAGWLSHPRVSPDGKYVACCVHPSVENNSGDVVVVPRDGGATRVAARDFSTLDGLAWTANSRALWISASRVGGNTTVHAITLDGRELAEHASAGRLRVEDRSAAGALAVSHIRGRMTAMVKPPGAATESPLGLSDITLVGAISGDGSSAAFLELGDVNIAEGAYVRPTDGGAAVQLGHGAPCDLDPQRGVLCTRGTRLAIFALGAGRPRIVDVPLDRVDYARWCANDGMLVAGATRDHAGCLWRFDGTTVTPLTDEGVLGGANVSPDGQRAALVANDRLLVIDIATARVREVGTFADDVVCGWSSDNRAALLRTTRVPVEIRRVEIDSGAVTPLQTVSPPPTGLRGVAALVASNDATAYAYSYGQELSRLFTMTVDDPT
jgi:tRNA A-37 threonylcarbamoyl transferase component Bud32